MCDKIGEYPRCPFILKSKSIYRFFVTIFFIDFIDEMIIWRNGLIDSNK